MQAKAISTNENLGPKKPTRKQLAKKDRQTARALACR